MRNILQEMESILPVLRKQAEWGTYFMGKFYFTIATNKSRVEVGLTNGNKQLESDFQRQLQYENYPALFHEYIHYLHELSTVIGTAGLGLDLSAKSIFTHWLDSNPKLAVSNGFTNDELGTKYSKAYTTTGVLFGDANEIIEGKFIEVKAINKVEQEVYFPYNTNFVKGKILVPKIEFSQLVNGQITPEYLHFGKYFLYEGLAYELDRVIDMQVKRLSVINDEAKGSEYIVLRKLAQFIFPQVEKQIYLSIGSMALQYIDCGNTFIQMLERVREEVLSGVSQSEIVKAIKKETSELLAGKRDDFMGAQDEYKNIFYKRKMLSQAFEYLTNKMKSLYDERIKNPTFEVDLVFEGKFTELLDIANVCDYMYLFNDADDYMRDFLGTSIDQETSLSLKALLSYDDFYKAHYFLDTSKVEKTKEHCCPFYRCCDLQLRTSQEEICRTKPWRIFEVSANSDNQYCWYGQGVLESKGHNEK